MNPVPDPLVVFWMVEMTTPREISLTNKDLNTTIMIGTLSGMNDSRRLQTADCESWDILSMWDDET